MLERLLILSISLCSLALAFYPAAGISCELDRRGGEGMGMESLPKLESLSHRLTSFRMG